MWPPTEPVPTLKQPPPPPGGLMTKTIAVPPPPPGLRPVGSNPPPFDARPSAPMPEGSPQPVFGGPIAPPPPPMPAPPPVQAPYPPPFPMGGASSVRPRWMSIAFIIAIVTVLGAVAAIAAFLVHRSLTETTSSGGGTGSTLASAAVIDAATAATTPIDASAAAVTPPDAERAVVTPVDAAVDEALVIDAAEAVIEEPVDAAPVEPAIDAGGDVAPPDPSDKLVIRSTPPGARVYINGADEGKTPVTIAASNDRHSLALVLPGHDLYLAEVDGKGAHDAKLVAVAPPEGPGGIKVRCKADDRYYVFLDGKPTGQLCPTERLGVQKGEHTIEVYDLVSETRKTFNARVKETRVSVRVRVDYD
jgi:hypothetical protein